MSSTHPYYTRLRLQQNFMLAPFELKAFIIFTTLATILALLVAFVLPNEFREALIPVTGWSPFMSYVLPCLLVFMQLSMNKHPNRYVKGQYLPILLLLIHLIFATFQTETWGGIEQTNPYLRVSVWQPVYTLALPLFWIFVLLSPRVTKFYKFLESTYQKTGSLNSTRKTTQFIK